MNRELRQPAFAGLSRRRFLKRAGLVDGRRRTR